MAQVDLFRCSACQGILTEVAAPAGYRCGGCPRLYPLVDDIPDFVVAPGGERGGSEATGVADTAHPADAVWERAEVVEARDTFYRLCHRELRGMACCIAEIGRRTDAGSAVLEVGAGTGHFTRWLAEVAHPEAAIYAFDRSWAMLQKARQQTQALPNVRLCRADGRGALPFAGESFDVVFVRLAPLRPPDVPAVRAAFDLLRPGGWCFQAGWQGERYATPPAQWATDHGFEWAAEHAWRYPRLRSEEEHVAALIDGPRQPYEFVDVARARAFTQAHIARHATAGGVPVMVDETLLIAYKPD